MPHWTERRTGGKRYSTVVVASSFSTVFWAGFSDPARAYALIQKGNAPDATTHLYESKDGGVAWHRVAIGS